MFATVGVTVSKLKIFGASEFNRPTSETFRFARCRKRAFLVKILAGLRGLG